VRAILVQITTSLHQRIA